EWEKRLAEFGLSQHQFKVSSLHRVTTNAEGTFPHANDPDLRKHWKSNLRSRFDHTDLSNIHRVGTERYSREVPPWALDNGQCRLLLSSLYPGLYRRKQQGYAAMIIYFAY